MLGSVEMCERGFNMTKIKKTAPPTVKHDHQMPSCCLNTNVRAVVDVCLQHAQSCRVPAPTQQTPSPGDGRTRWAGEIQRRTAGAQKGLF